jgi:hypothetical protein
MFKKLTILLFFTFFIFITIPFFCLIDYSQTITLKEEKVIYEMPYPGILPDHPLYTLKAIRDRIWDFSTRDLIKKAKLYLLFSDKRIMMGQALVKINKSDLAISITSKGEKYFLKIPPLLIQSKKQGVSPSQELVNKIKSSNLKHKEMIQNLFKEIPEGEQIRIQEILEINKTIKKQLSDL